MSLGADIAGGVRSHTPRPDTPDRVATWTLIAVTATLYVIACIDRQVLPLLIEPIKHSYHVSDERMGLLIGLGFSFFYSLASLPAGALADRRGRRGLLAAAAGIWSIMTLSSGCAPSYAAMFLTRAGIGTAEGVIAPVSYSLIRDRVPLAVRGTAFSIFSMAPYLGGSLALIVGGALLSAAAGHGFDRVPLLRGLEPWRIVLIVIGGASLALTALPALLSRDDRRAGIAGAATTASFAEALRYMFVQRRIYGPLILYTTLSTLVIFANGPWLPALIARRFGTPLAQIGYSYGLVKLIAAPLGLLFVGVVLDRLARGGRGICGFGVLTSLVTLLAFACVPFAPSANATYLLKGVGLLFSGGYAAIGAVILADRTPGPLVGKVTVIYLLFQSVFGTGMGPLMAGFLSSSVLGGDPLAIGGGMFLTTIGIGVPALIALVLLRRALELPVAAQEET